MTLGVPMPIALPVTNSSAALGNNCSLSLPFRVQPVQFNTSQCYQGLAQNNSYDIDVGFQTFSTCSLVTNHSAALCPAPGHVLVCVLVCGGSLAFTSLPTNWTRLCVLAVVLPDISLIPGDEPVPLPSLEYIAGRHKRAVLLVPLLVGLGVSGALATGSAGMGVALHSYAKLSNQLIDDVQALSGTITDIQDQIDSLAEVVLQNRRGLDLLTAEQGGICLALQERCCFYANKSGIVRDKIKELQEDLVKRRRELFENPFWSGLNGFLPYLLPLLGPLLGLLILLSLGPVLFKKLMAFLKSQIEAIKMEPIQVHYHKLEMADQGTYLEV
ncbi:syncytin-2-like [Heterocephalus glaber]|uniref:Syncytin-2-like n=1 Tax=Heterocephalus glaber TaxID=10181 RepID=A0AAX6P7Z2_HETGA|nr:syncytin-2-like [Heterocephalus glaber]